MRGIAERAPADLLNVQRRNSGGDQLRPILGGQIETPETRDCGASAGQAKGCCRRGAAGPVAPTYFNYRKVSIYGGSNEIQKNIIAKAILGL